MPELVHVTAAAHSLGISVPTLRRWLRQGAPQARRGRRGRGGDALVDPAAVRAWRASCAVVEHADLEVLAGELPELVGRAVAEAFAAVEGPHKRAAAGVLAGAWYVVTTKLLDRLRRDVPRLRDPDVVPAQIDHLRAIYGGARR
jgi:hypothetical protein